MDRLCRNNVYLRGNVVTEPEYNHQYGEIQFYRFFISTKRLSGVDDVILVIVSKQLLDESKIKIGDNVDVLGSYRSYNNEGKLVLYVFVESIISYKKEKFANTVRLSGFVCKKGDIRETPNGKVIMDVLLAVNRPNSKTSYIPCIFWNVTEEEHQKINNGDELGIIGRVQSRDYVKVHEDETQEVKTAYEVSVREYTKI